MGGWDEEVPWFGEDLVVLGAAFSGSWFAAAGPVWKFVHGDAPLVFWPFRSKVRSKGVGLVAL